MAPSDSLFVRRDISVGQKQLTVVNLGIAFRDIGAALPQGFDLGPHQNDATFDIVFDRVIIPRSPVIGDHLVVWVFFRLGHRADVGPQPATVQPGPWQNAN